MNGKKPQFLNTSKAISEWLDEHYVKNYTINDDLTVDANGHVDICGENLERIPVKFGNVVGSFLCHNNYLVNLAGSPKTVGFDFYCHNNKLTSLAGSPKTIGSSFYCCDNLLTSLAGSPKSVGKSFSCVNNKLISLTELINCDFKEEVYFNIDENNFKQKEVIQILGKYYNSDQKYYELTNRQFQDIIKPLLQKQKLQKELFKVSGKTKINKNFL